MSGAAESIDARIAGRNFTLACGADERADLEAALALVSERVEEAQAASSGSSSERLLLLAALNLAHDLRRLKNVRGGHVSGITSNDAAALNALAKRIDSALKKRE